MEIKSGVQKSLDALFRVAPAHGATPLAAPSLEVGERPVGSAPQRALPSSSASANWEDVVNALNAERGLVSGANIAPGLAANFAKGAK